MNRKDPPRQGRCIFCLTVGPGSEEHIFPLAVGGSMTTWRVCEPCNSRLGSDVDAALSNHLLVKVCRARLRLAGNSGMVPEPILEMLKDGHLASDRKQPVRTLLAADGKLEPRLVYTKKRLSLGDLEVDRITLDAREALGRLPTILARERKRRGLPPLPPSQMQAEVERLLETRETLADTTVHGSFFLNLDAPDRALMKIAYELAFLWLGETYLDDPMADALRSVILDGKDTAEAGVECRSTPGLLDWFQSWRTFGDSHVAFASSGGETIVVALKVFNAFSAAVVVSRHAGRYSAQGPGWPGHLVEIDAATGERRDGNLVAGFERAVRAVRRRYWRIAALVSVSPLAVAFDAGSNRAAGNRPLVLRHSRSQLATTNR